MKKLEFTKEIKAPVQKVWDILYETFQSID